MTATISERGGDTSYHFHEVPQPTFHGRVFRRLQARQVFTAVKVALRILLKPVVFAVSLAGRTLVRCVPSTWLCSLFDRHPFSRYKFRAALENLQEASQQIGKGIFGDLGEILTAIRATLKEVSEENTRHQFSQVLQLIRQGLHTAEYREFLAGKAYTETEAAAQELNYLCYVHYHSNSTTNCVAKLMDRYLEICGHPNKEEAPVSTDPLTSARAMLRHIWKRLASLEEMPEDYQVPIRWQSARKLLEHVNFNVDPQQDGNLPYPMFYAKVDNGTEVKDVINIRMGTQTVQGWASESDNVVEVVPEFLGYMRYLKSQGKRHLYVNLQDRNYPHHWKHEDDRCRALEQAQVKVPETLTVITLEKDSDFYKQQGEYENQPEYATLRAELKRRLDDPHSGFYFPQKLRDEVGNFSDKMVMILDHIHEQLFDKAESLDLRARQDLLEIFYVHLVEYLILTLDVSSFNLSCKNCIDRGGGANAMFLLYLAARMGMSFTGNLKKGGLNTLVGPGLFVKGRLLRPERGHRLVSVLERLFESPEAMAKLTELELGVPHQARLTHIGAL